MAIDDNSLEQVIKSAGVGKRTADKLRRANKTQADTEAASTAAPAATTASSPKPRGHGSPSSAIADLGDDF